MLVQHWRGPLGNKPTANAGGDITSSPTVISRPVHAAVHAPVGTGRGATAAASDEAPGPNAAAGRPLRPYDDATSRGTESHAEGGAAGLWAGSTIPAKTLPLAVALDAAVLDEDPG